MYVPGVRVYYIRLFGTRVVVAVTLTGGRCVRRAVQDKQDGRAEQTTAAHKAVKPQRLQPFRIIGTPGSPHIIPLHPIATIPRPALPPRTVRFAEYKPRTLDVFLTDRINLIGPIK